MLIHRLPPRRILKATGQALVYYSVTLLFTDRGELHSASSEEWGGAIRSAVQASTLAYEGHAYSRGSPKFYESRAGRACIDTEDWI